MLQLGPPLGRDRRVGEGAEAGRHAVHRAAVTLDRVDDGPAGLHRLEGVVGDDDAGTGPGDGEDVGRLDAGGGDGDGGRARRGGRVRRGRVRRVRRGGVRLGGRVRRGGRGGRVRRGGRGGRGGRGQVSSPLSTTDDTRGTPGR